MAIHPNGKWKSGIVAMAIAMVCLLFLTRCHIDQSAGPGEGYVTVRLNDSLKRYDSVDIAILVAADTSTLVGRVWAGPLTDPGAIPPYRLDDSETRELSIRVRGFDSDRVLRLDMLITREAGVQVVKDLPIPRADTSDPGPGAKPSSRLASLSVSRGDLSPAFDSSHIAYGLDLAFAESTFTLNAAPKHAGAVMTLDGVAIAAGTVTTIKADTGKTSLALKVAAGGNETVYAILVERGSIRPDTSTPTNTDPHYKAWKFKGAVSINVESLGLPRDTLVKGFPLLLRLNESNFKFFQAEPGGKDIRIAKADGTPLPFEIGRWEYGASAKTAKADIWIRVDSLRATDNPLRLYLYWGNPAAPSMSDGTKVFAKEDGHVGVYHLAEQGKGDAGEYRDAGGGFHGTGGTGDGKHLPARMDGIVGYGQDFSATAQGTIVLPDDFDPGEQSWTYHAWIKREGSAGGVLFAKGDDYIASNQRFQVAILPGDGGQLAILREGSEMNTGTYITEGVYTHLGVVYRQGLMEIYVDGFERERITWTQGSKRLGRAVIGSVFADGSLEGFTGILDEVWFAGPARSAPWMRLMFECQKPTATFVNFRMQ